MFHSTQGQSLPIRYLRRVGLDAFLRWWGSGLLACLPESLRRRFSETPTRLLIEVGEKDILFSREEGGSLRNQERYPLETFEAGGLRGQGDRLLAKAKQVVLRLPAHQVLSRAITLPLAAEKNLHQVVGFEIDRLTPFSREQVYYDVEIVERHSAQRRIRVRFVAAPREWVDVLVRRLAAMDLPLDRVDVGGQESEINLLPPEHRPRTSRFVRRLQGALALLALLLLLAASLLPLWQQRSLVIELLQRVDVAQREAETIFALRQQLEDSIESSRFLLQKKQNSVFMIDLLDELTKLLPDSTWVEQMEIRGNEIQIRGQSSEASALIGLVEASERFHGVTFRSPVVTDRRTGQDRFFLAAQITQASR